MSSAQAKIERYQALGFGGFAICMAKTQYSFSANPAAKVVPSLLTDGPIALVPLSKLGAVLLSRGILRHAICHFVALCIAVCLTFIALALGGVAVARVPRRTLSCPSAMSARTSGPAS